MRRIVFSLFFFFDGDCQSGSFLIQCNRDKLSTRKFDVGVSHSWVKRRNTRKEQMISAYPPKNGHH